MANATQGAGHGAGYRLYWIAWVFLLVVTMIMLAMEYVSWPTWILLTVLLGAMLLKAGVISGYFMHLRYEKPALIVIVAAGILAVAAIMFIIMAIDAARVGRLVPG
jgi:caa(3)-type oxidase subunit IV